MSVLFSISKQKIINKHLRFKTERNFWQGRTKPELAEPHLLEGTYSTSCPKASGRGFTAVIKPKASIWMLKGCDTIFGDSRRPARKRQICLEDVAPEPDSSKNYLDHPTLPHCMSRIRAKGFIPQNGSLLFCVCKTKSLFTYSCWCFEAY